MTDDAGIREWLSPEGEAHWRTMAAHTDIHFWFSNREVRVLFAEIDRLRAREARMREALMWQPIETAPLEPKAIIGKTWDGHVHPVWWNRTYPRWEWCSDGYHSGAAPRLTHWMPVPTEATLRGEEQRLK